MTHKLKLHKGLIIVILSLALFGCKNQRFEWEHLIVDGNVSQWHGDGSDSFPKAGWIVEEDELIVNKPADGDPVQAGNLFTKKAYGNFEFYWEWKMMTVGGNSGVKYFVPGRKDSWSSYGPGPEYQMLDDVNHPWMLEGKMIPNDHFTLGSCYELYAADSTKAPAPLGQWNTSRIVSMDGHVEHWLNGQKIVEYNRFSEDFSRRVLNSKFKEFPKYGRLEKGHIMLQDHGGYIHFRNLKIKSYDP